MHKITVEAVNKKLNTYLWENDTDFSCLFDKGHSLTYHEVLEVTFLFARIKHLPVLILESAVECMCELIVK